MIQEGELVIDFSAAIRCDKLDEQGRSAPHGMSFVDFVVEEERRFLLVEVKDWSSNPKGTDAHAGRAVENERHKNIKELHDNTLIHHRLTPKARNSYLYLHLMGRDTKPMRFVFLLGASKLSLEQAILGNFKERLRGRLEQEIDTPWARQYVSDCVVLTEETWGMAFPQYALKRIS